MKGTLLQIFILVAITSLSGCRIGTAVFEGGDVISASGERHCFEGSTCEFQVTDSNFTESFTAKPRAGFEFVKWKTGNGFFCGGSTNPTCNISNVGSEGNAGAEALIASDEMFYLMPEFKCVLQHCPLRPDPNWRALDEALVALEDAKEIVAAYVAENGHGAADASVYGINLSSRNSDMLHRLKISADTGTSDGHIFYITAEVFKSVWEGGTPNAAEIGAFSLSGSTNWDHSMTWDCIPAGAPGSSYPAAISEPYLPLNCRG
ncbi:MAG: hypothetical protein R3E64_17185 [Halioglobus sp.]